MKKRLDLIPSTIRGPINPGHQRKALAARDRRYPMFVKRDKRDQAALLAHLFSIQTTQVKLEFTPFIGIGSG
jgi:hypothetical protein